MRRVELARGVVTLAAWYAAASCAREAVAHDTRSPSVASPPPAPLAARVRIECGKVEVAAPARLRLRSACVRVLLGKTPRSSAAIAFTYVGPTPVDVPLASGELRRQIGLKLRARDTCNVVYVMWHVGSVDRHSRCR